MDKGLLFTVKHRMVDEILGVREEYEQIVVRDMVEVGLMFDKLTSGGHGPMGCDFYSVVCVMPTEVK